MKTASVLIILLGAFAMQAQQTKPQEDATDSHAAMTARGDQAMGFSHEKTTHHFRLSGDGGAIEVSANDPKDSESREMIRMHLSHISKMFAAGNFDAPMFIHVTNPPGVPTMTELRDQIHYQYEETDAGARVRIQTANKRALAAVHDFLRFQISEHQTGDSTAISSETQKK